MCVFLRSVDRPLTKFVTRLTDSVSLSQCAILVMGEGDPAGAFGCKGNCNAERTAALAVHNFHCGK